MDDKKAQLLRDVAGDVAEIGCGTGTNFKFYGEGVNTLYAVEPNLEMYPMIEQARGTLKPSIKLQVLPGIAQNLTQFKDNSVDNIVLFHVLCTIGGVHEALLEFNRILKR